MKFEDGTDKDGWPLDMKKQLLKAYSDYRQGEPKKNYWARIARDFPGFTKDQVKEKVISFFCTFLRNKNHFKLIKHLLNVN